MKFTNTDGLYAQVNITEIGSPSQQGGYCNLVYTTDNVNWYDYTVGDDITLYYQDDFVTFKAKNDSTGGLKSVDGSNYYKFSGISTSGLKVEGNISYLYSSDPDNNYMQNY